MRSLIVLLALAWSAPFQCSSERDPAEALEDPPDEALWGLAQRFEKAGDRAARRRTLEYLVERYPSSRYAAQARSELEAAP